MVGQLTTEPAPSPRHLLELLQQFPGPLLDLDLLSRGGRFGPAHRRQKSATPAHPPAAAAAASDLLGSVAEATARIKSRSRKKLPRVGPPAARRELAPRGPHERRGRGAAAEGGRARCPQGGEWSGEGVGEEVSGASRRGRGTSVGSPRWARI